MCLAGCWSTLETTTHPRIATGTGTVHVEASCPSVRHENRTIFSGPDTGLRHVQAWNSKRHIKTCFQLKILNTWQLMQGMRCDAPCGGRVRQIVIERLLPAIVVLVHRRSVSPQLLSHRIRAAFCKFQLPGTKALSRHGGTHRTWYVGVFRPVFHVFPLSVPSLGPLNRLILFEQVAFVKRWRVCRSAHRRRGTRSTTSATEWWTVTPRELASTAKLPKKEVRPTGQVLSLAA